MSVYAELGVRTHINATASLTVLGGTLMPDEVLDAMRSAASAFVRIPELQDRVGREIARLTHNEAAYVTSGCAAGLALAVMASRTRGEQVAVARISEPEFPGGSALPRDVVMLNCHRMPYDLAIGLAGGRIRTVGNTLQAYEWELEAAITDATCAVLYVAGSLYARGSLPLESIVRIAHSHDVPVIVDAAAQLPPVENLWRFTRELGADVAVFSGGKEMRGPQSSGLIVGSEHWIEAIKLIGPPNQRLGRAFKVGKEEIAGLYAAVRRFTGMDHDQWYRDQYHQCTDLATLLSTLPGITAVVEDRNRAGARIPRVRVELPATLCADDVVERLSAGEPSIVIRTEREHSVHVGLDLLRPGEIQIVRDRLVEALSVATGNANGPVEVDGVGAGAPAGTLRSEGVGQ